MNLNNLIYELKELKLDGVIGIYMIYCSANTKYYIGSTTQGLKKRWNKHKNELNRGIHHSNHLQKAWDLYRPKHFECFFVEVLTSTDTLIDREQYYLDKFAASDEDFGFNINPIAGSCLGRKCSEEHKKKISEANKKTYKDPIKRKAISDRMKGIHVSDLTREKLRKANLGKKYKEETKRKLSLALQGHKACSKLTKEQIIQIRQNPPKGYNAKLLLASSLGVTVSTIYKILSRLRWRE